jgi:sigma-E factor negative regulatory protein RseC
MFKSEEFIEEGVVESISGEIAEVKVLKHGGCEECSAKIFCSSNTNDNIVLAVDSLGAKKGDYVRLSVQGRNLAFASNLLYSVPLVLLLSGMLLGSLLFTENIELKSTVLSLLFIGLYGVILYFYNKGKDKSSLMPHIITVRKTGSD